jgi:pimeloyl-ACP methyl ester carboxylesterase
MNFPNATGDQGGGRIEIKKEIPVYAVSTEADFRKWAEFYHYERTPLDPQIVETVETDVWRREKITFNGAGGERAIAYLYLPKNYPRPLQVINYIPAADVDRGLRSLTISVEDRLAALLRSGRAVFSVVLKGYSERLLPPTFQYPDKATAEYRDFVVHRVTDIRRGIDYLETRDDVDARKIALYAPSAGARSALVTGALEQRYGCVFLIGAGIMPDDARIIPEANTINFAPHINGPKLMLQGKFDEDTPLKTQSEPLFKLLREPKEMILFDGGHVPTPETTVPIATKFLDDNLGPVRRE